MSFIQPVTWTEALQARAEFSDHLPIAGGTDVMVDFNFDRRRPCPVLDLRRIEDIDQWWRSGSSLRLGAGVPYARIVAELPDLAPGLAQASRTVASPQVRNRGTVGGNLATASPAGDSAPPLFAVGAEVEVRTAHGERRIPVRDFFAGVKRSVLGPDELITAVWLKTASGLQQFAKIGTRNAMVISVASLALSLEPRTQSVGTGMGSVGPTPTHSPDAEAFLAGELRAGNYWHTREDLPDSLVSAFAAKTAASIAPIDDVRGSAAYRIHALRVMAHRTLKWAWSDYQKGLAPCE